MPKEKKPPVPNVSRGSVPVIAMDAVESTQIAFVGHDAKSNTLALRFKQWDGTTSDEYQYSNFTVDDLADFKAAESLGSYHGKRIRDNPAFPCVRVREELVAVGATDV